MRELERKCCLSVEMNGNNHDSTIPYVVPLPPVVYH